MLVAFAKDSTPLASQNRSASHPASQRKPGFVGAWLKKEGMEGRLGRKAQSVTIPRLAVVVTMKKGRLTRIRQTPSTRPLFIAEACGLPHEPYGRIDVMTVLSVGSWDAASHHNFGRLDDHPFSAHLSG